MKQFMKTKTIFFAFTGLFLLASCTHKNKQPKDESLLKKTEQAEAVDTNKVFEVWEVDEPPVMP